MLSVSMFGIISIAIISYQQAIYVKLKNHLALSTSSLHAPVLSELFVNY